MSVPIGSYEWHKNLGPVESSVVLTADFSARNELVPVASGGGGLTITSCTWQVYLLPTLTAPQGIITSDFSLSGFVVNSSIGPDSQPVGTLAQVTVTDAAVYPGGAKIGQTYRLVCAATLSSGEVLNESIDVYVAN